MKNFASIAVVASLLLASCASPVQRRLERNPALFAKLPETQKASVVAGRVTEGMSKDAVFLAWGRASRISTGKRDGKAFERWIYMGYEPVYRYENEFGMTSSYGGYAMARRGNHARYGCDPHGHELMMFRSGPTVDYVPYNEKMVEFVGGVVVAFAVPK